MLDKRDGSGRGECEGEEALFKADTVEEVLPEFGWIPLCFRCFSRIEILNRGY